MGSDGELLESLLRTGNDDPRLCAYSAFPEWADDQQENSRTVIQGPVFTTRVATAVQSVAREKDDMDVQNRDTKCVSTVGQDSVVNRPYMTRKTKFSCETNSDSELILAGYSR